VTVVSGRGGAASPDGRAVRPTTARPTRARRGSWTPGRVGLSWLLPSSAARSLTRARASEPPSWLTSTIAPLHTARRRSWCNRSGARYLAPRLVDDDRPALRRGTRRASNGTNTRDTMAQKGRSIGAGAAADPPSTRQAAGAGRGSRPPDRPGAERGTKGSDDREKDRHQGPGRCRSSARSAAANRRPGSDTLVAPVPPALAFNRRESPRNELLATTGSAEPHRASLFAATC
jgi:hypothetical protein